MNQNITTGYIGFDPTADSLHIGSLVQIMILIHFQRAGHRPIALVGGSTGLIGDPSGKSDERKLLDAKELQKNVDGIRNQLKKFLDFDPANPKAAQLVNNYDWTKDYSLIDFSRDIGKHLTVNYMMAKDSVKNASAAMPKWVCLLPNLPTNCSRAMIFCTSIKTWIASCKWGAVINGEISLQEQN